MPRWHQLEYSRGAKNLRQFRKVPSKYPSWPLDYWDMPHNQRFFFQELCNSYAILLKTEAVFLTWASNTLRKDSPVHHLSSSQMNHWRYSTESSVFNQLIASSSNAAQDNKTLRCLVDFLEWFITWLKLASEWINAYPKPKTFWYGYVWSFSITDTLEGVRTTYGLSVI